jgi:hypothetical protein
VDGKQLTGYDLPQPFKVPNKKEEEAKRLLLALLLYPFFFFVFVFLE